MIKSCLLAASLSCLLLNVARADIIFDNGNHVQYYANASYGHGGPFYVADSFVLPTDATLTGITWKGIQGSDQPQENFEISIYADDGTGKPVSPPPNSTIYSEPATLSDKHLTGEMWGTEPFYQYTASLPNFSLSSGTKYWLQVFNATSQTWSWAISYDVPEGEKMYLNQPLITGNRWEPYNGSQAATFQLIGTVPEPASYSLDLIRLRWLRCFGCEAL